MANELERKKFVIPEESNPAINSECYLDVSVNLEGGFSIRTHDYEREVAPSFHGDNRIRRLHLVLPKADASVNILPAKTAASSSFIGSSCCTCRLPTGKKSHSITDRPICLIIGDEYVPLLCGDKGNCCPTMRIESGSLAQSRKLLEYHIEAGFKPKPGSVAVVLLLAHLLRVGHDDFWQELSEFSVWAATKHLTVLPGLPPYPTGLRHSDLMCIGQFMQHLVTANYGATVVSSRSRFLLWRPTVLSFEQHHAQGADIMTPPTKVVEMDGRRFDTTVRVSEGLTADWKHGIPRGIELAYLTNLAASLKDFSKKSTKSVTIPTNDEIFSGLENEPTPATSPHHGKTIFLLGHSILASSTLSLEKIVNPWGAKVVSLCMIGATYKDLFEGNNLDALTGAKSTDVLVFSFLGNVMLRQQRVISDYAGGSKTMHLVKPSIIDNTAFSTLVQHTNRALTYLRTYFPGKILFLLPTPRHLSPCCKQPDHIIVDHGDHPVGMLNYVTQFNHLISQLINLPHNTEIISYQEIFGTDTPVLHDGVHLDKTEQPVLADFLANSFDRPETLPVPATGQSADFHALLVEKKVISNTLPPAQAPSLFIDQAQQAPQPAQMPQLPPAQAQQAQAPQAVQPVLHQQQQQPPAQAPNQPPVLPQGDAAPAGIIALHQSLHPLLGNLKGGAIDEAIRLLQAQRNANNQN